MQISTFQFCTSCEIWGVKLAAQVEHEVTKDFIQEFLVDLEKNRDQRRIAANNGPRTLASWHIKIQEEIKVPLTLRPSVAGAALQTASWMTDS